MPLTLHTLAPRRGARTPAFRIGRGLGTGRGKTSGRGTKGQRSRTGGRNKLRLKGMKQMLLSMPKQRGFTSLKPKATTIALERLEVFAAGTRVDQAVLYAQGFLRRGDSAKIVAGGKLSKSIHLIRIPASAGAKQAIVAAGGSVTERKAGKKASAKTRV